MKYSLFFVCCGLLFASCCQKVGCPDYVHVEKALVFHNFNSEELDSILLVRYEPNTDFKNVIDSVMTQALESRYLDYSIVPLTKEYVYQVYLPVAGKTYFIDNFGFQKGKNCNACFPARPKWAYMDEFTSYTLNGKQQSGKFITIEK